MQKEGKTEWEGTFKNEQGACILSEHSGEQVKIRIKLQHGTQRESASLSSHKTVGEETRCPAWKVDTLDYPKI